MKKIIFTLLTSFCSLSFAQHLPEIELKLNLVRENVQREIDINQYEDETIKDYNQITLESMQMMSTIPSILFLLEESGDIFFKYQLYAPNTEYAVKMISELNTLMSTDSKSWKRKYILSNKAEIELTEDEKIILGRTIFPRVTMNQVELQKYSRLTNNLSIAYETLLKKEKEAILQLSRSLRENEQTRMEIIEKTWNKKLQDNQDILYNWSKSL